MKLKHAFHLFTHLVVLAGFTLCAGAQVEGPPPFVDYQGTIYDSNQKPFGSAGNANDGYTSAPENLTMEFRIYDIASGGNEDNVIWAETQTVTVSLGQFSVRLGLGAKIVAPELPHESLAAAFDGSARFLELTVVNPGQPSSPILPRLAFQSSPFAFVAARAKVADSVKSLSGGLLKGVVGDPVRIEGPVNADGANFADGTFQDGIFQDGTFEDAAINNGTFTGGAFTGGTFAGAFTGTFAGTFSGDGSGLTSVPANVARLDRNGQTFAGDRTITGNLTVKGRKVVVGNNDGRLAGLRIVAGRFYDKDAGVSNKVSGVDFRAWKTSTGKYTISFEPPFESVPVITANTWADQTDNFMVIKSVTESEAKLECRDNGDTDDYQDSRFMFIAIGTQ